jgi:hypothetical protein
MSGYNQSFNPFDLGSRMFDDGEIDVSQTPPVMTGNAPNATGAYAPPGFSPMGGMDVPGFSRVQIPFAQGAEANTFNGAIRNGLAMRNLMQNQAAQIQQSRAMAQMQMREMGSKMIDEAASRGDFRTAAILTKQYAGQDVSPQTMQQNYQIKYMGRNPQLMQEAFRQGQFKLVGPSLGWTPNMIAQAEDDYQKYQQHEKEVAGAKAQVQQGLAETRAGAQVEAAGIRAGAVGAGGSKTGGGVGSSADVANATKLDIAEENSLRNELKDRQTNASSILAQAKEFDKGSPEEKEVLSSWRDAMKDVSESRQKLADFRSSRQVSPRIGLMKAGYDVNGILSQLKETGKPEGELLTSIWRQLNSPDPDVRSFAESALQMHKQAK